MARIGFLSLSATGYSMALAKAMEEHGHERVFFNVVDRERAITERGLSFVLYGFEEYPAGSLAGIFEKTGRLKGVEGFQYLIERMLTQVIELYNVGHSPRPAYDGVAAFGDYQGLLQLFHLKTTAEATVTAKLVRFSQCNDVLNER